MVCIRLWDLITLKMPKTLWFLEVKWSVTITTAVQWAIEGNYVYMQYPEQWALSPSHETHIKNKLPCLGSRQTKQYPKTICNEHFIISLLFFTWDYINHGAIYRSYPSACSTPAHNHQAPFDCAIKGDDVFMPYP